MRGLIIKKTWKIVIPHSFSVWNPKGDLFGVHYLAHKIGNR